MNQQARKQVLSHQDLAIQHLVKSITPTHSSVRPEVLSKLVVHKFGVPKRLAPPVIVHQLTEARAEAVAYAHT